MRHLVCLGIGILLCASGVGAQNEKGAEQQLLAGGSGGFGKALDRNIRLEFKIVPLEPENRGLWIVVASSVYRASAHFTQENSEIEFSVNGQIMPQDNGKILLGYECSMSLKGQGSGAQIKLGSSALLVPGVELPVGSVGDKTLVVKASFLE